MSGRSIEIDLVKTVAIISVIILHSVSIAVILGTGMIYYVWQAIPLFIICSGLTWYLAFAKHASTLHDAYSLRYFKGKIGRFVAPFLVIFVFDLIYMKATGIAFNLNHIISRLYWMQPPLSGAGDYYLAYIIQLIILAPLLCYCFSRKPWITVAVLFIVDIMFELAAPYLSFDFYYFSVVRCLAAFAIGLILARNIIQYNGWRLRTKTNVALVVLGLLSAIYLTFYVSVPTPGFRPEWGTQNLYGFFYPALLVILVFSCGSLLQRAKGLVSKVNVLGRASYHIFLVQILFFGLGVNGIFAVKGELIAVMINLAVTFAVGLLFYGLNLTVLGLTRNSRISKKSPSSR